MNLLVLLEQTGPVLQLQLLLAQNELDLTVGVVGLAVLRVDFAEQVQRDRVGDTLAGGTGEGDIVGGDAQLSIGLGDIGSLQVHVEVVALGIRVGGALGPGNYPVIQLAFLRSFNFQFMGYSIGDYPMLHVSTWPVQSDNVVTD